MKLQFLFIVSILLLINISCKKKSDPIPNSPSSGNCHIKQVRSGNILRNLEYKDGKLFRGIINAASGKDIKEYVSEIKYYNDSVIENFIGLSYDLVLGYKIGSNGKIEYRGTKNVRVATNDVPTVFSYDTVYYEYDIDGYLVKEEFISRLIKDDGSYPERNTHTITIYTIDNDNVISKTDYRDGLITNTVNYEYYTDLINRNDKIDVSRNLQGVTLWHEANGKMNKNLLKKEFAGSSVKEYFYDLDQYGNVIKQKVSRNGDLATTAIEVVYDCD